MMVMDETDNSNGQDLMMVMMDKAEVLFHALLMHIRRYDLIYAYISLVHLTFLFMHISLDPTSCIIPVQNSQLTTNNASLASR